MIPSNSSHRSYTPGVLSSKDVLWQGPDLKCINVCTGATVTEVTASVASEVCKILDTLNLTDVDFKCLIDTCLACPQPDKTLKTALRLLINKTCKLEELINKSTSTVPDIPVFQINLKCLAITDGSGNVLNDDTNDKIIQSIIDQVCLLRADVDLAKNDIISIDNRVTILEQASKPPTVPNVVSECLFIGPKPLDQAWTDIDTAWCETSEALGTPADLNKAISQQCPTLAQKFVLNPNFTISPRNAAQSMRNMWVALCDALDRISKIEKTCCQATCEQVKVGFNIVFSETQTATLKFTSGAGTNIPTGFIDCGSTLIVSDALGNNVVVENMNLNNNVEVPDVDMTGFREGNILTFTLHAKFCSEEIGTCESVVTKTAIYKNACSTCEIVNTGDGESIIVFETPGEYQQNSVVVIDQPTTTSTTSTSSSTGHPGIP